MKKEKVKEVLNGMLDIIEQKQIDLYNKLIDEKCFDETKNIEEFYFSLIYPHQEFISGLIKSEISQNEDVIYIIKKFMDIKRHFEYWLHRIEGYTCCADKSSTIMEHLLKFYKEGTQIKFDYKQKYTFHLPKIIFKTHKSIINFYEAVKSLNCGNPTKYLIELKELNKELE